MSNLESELQEIKLGRLRCDSGLIGAIDFRRVLVPAQSKRCMSAAKEETGN